MGKNVITESEYKLLKKLDELGPVRYHDLSRREKITCLKLIGGGLVDMGLEEEIEKELENGEVMLHKNAGGKAYDSEKRIEPELNPRTSGIFTPAAMRGLLVRCALGFFTGLICGYLLEMIVEAL